MRGFQSLLDRQMRKLILAIFLILGLMFTMNNTEAQSRSHKTAFYAEAFGPGLLYSINYDWRFKKDYRGHGARVGVSALNFSEGFWAAIPISYNFIFANNFKTSVELGAGMTFALGEAEFLNFADRLVFGHLIAGVRYRPFENGFFFKAAWTPIITDDKTSYVFGNVGFGFSM